MTKAKILLVEDDEALALMVHKRLEAISNECQLEAVSGDPAEDGNDED